MKQKSSSFYIFFVVMGLVLVVAGAPSAQAGWLDFLNPRAKSSDIKDNPAVTLRAPFADENAVLDELDTTGNSGLAVPLDQRHRPNTEIVRWVREIVPAVLSYNSNNYEQEYAEKIKFFNKVGTEEYVAYLQNKSIVKTLRTGRYNVSGIIEEEPVIINEGAVDGRYRWLFQIPVMVTYLDNNMTRYSRSNEDSVITRKFVVTLQLGRVRGADNEHGLLIETWNVKDAE